MAASQFSSPKKSDDTLIAYVHNLSPSKRNRKDTLDYCTLTLQTEDSTKDALLYSRSKRPLLCECENKRSPIKIQRFTYTDDGQKFVINDMTKLAQPLPTEYEFQFEPPTANLCPKFNVEQIQKLNDWELITFQGKVLQKSDAKVVGSRKLDLVESTFADTSGTISVSLWGGLITTVEVGKVYQISPVQTRTWNGIKKLSTTPNSVARPVLNSELDQIPKPDNFEESANSAFLTKKFSKIHHVQSVETLVLCITCGRRLHQATGGKFVQCSRCQSYMRTAECSRKKCVRTVLESQDVLLHLTAFEDVLKEVCEDLTEMTEGSLGEHLLELENISITYDSSTRTIKKLSVD